MKGKNKADLRTQLDLLRAQIENPNFKDGDPCVFISHKNEDTEACEPIAEYLMNADIDIYFDKYDKDLSQIAHSGNADKLTQQLQRGIDDSTHMICVVSPLTVRSYWVPFEVGYGYDRLTLGILTLKGIDDTELPDYMKTTEVIRGIKSLNAFIARLLGQPRKQLEERNLLHKHSRLSHPLDRVLDWKR